MDSVFAYLAEHFDLPILSWIAQHLHSAFGDAVMPVITVLGDAGIFWILAAVVFLFIPKWRRVGLSMGAALILGLLICNMTMKPLFARIRPYDYLARQGITVDLLISAQHDFSFPSGHTLASFEGATVLMLHNRKLGIPALILAILISFSRLYLHVHYPTDVICSVFLGIGIAFLGNYLVQKGFAIYGSRKQLT